jgi:hypothetical protein
MIEKLPLLVHLRLLHDSNGVVGILFEVSCADKCSGYQSANQARLLQCVNHRTPKRRHCWFNLDVLHLLDGISTGQYFHGRDGINVSSITRPIHAWSDH